MSVIVMFEKGMKQHTKIFDIFGKLSTYTIQEPKAIPTVLLQLTTITYSAAH